MYSILARSGIPSHLRRIRIPFDQFLFSQLIDILEWSEPEDGILAYRFPMLDQEIQNGGQLLDSCETCLLLWLDHGELKRIARADQDQPPSLENDPVFADPFN